MSETNIPSEIKDRIGQFAIMKSFNFQGNVTKFAVNCFKDGAEYGYLLASKTIDEKDEEIKILKDQKFFYSQSNQDKDRLIASLEAEKERLVKTLHNYEKILEKHNL